MYHKVGKIRIESGSEADLSFSPSHHLLVTEREKDGEKSGLFYGVGGRLGGEDVYIAIEERGLNEKRSGVKDIGGGVRVWYGSGCVEGGRVE